MPRSSYIYVLHARILCAVALLLLLSVKLDAALIGHWTFDETSGCTATDATGNGHCGTNTGAAVNACGIIGTAYDFEQSCTDWVQVTDAAQLDVNSFSFAGWIFKENNGGRDVVINKPCVFTFRLEGNCTPRFCTVHGGSNNTLSSGTTFADCAWIFVSGTFCRTTGAKVMYKCGNSIGSGIRTADLDTSCNDLYIGGSFQNFDGEMDDFSFWNESLTGCEVESMYDIGLSCCFNYNASSFDSLKQIHDAGTGTVTICGTTWGYATCLTQGEGLSVCGTGHVLVLDDGACTGLRTLSYLYWDTNGTTAGSGNAGGCWNGAATNWNPCSAGTSCTVTFTNCSDVFFAAGTDANTTNKTVTVSCTRTVSSLNFEEGRFTLSGGTISLGDCTPDIVVACGVTATISSTVSGSNGLNKTGAGTLELTGTLSYSGNTCVTGGTLARTGTWVENAGETTTISGGADMTVSSNVTVSGAGNIAVTGCGSTLSTATGNVSIQSGTLSVQCGADVNLCCGSLSFGAFLVGNGTGTVSGSGSTVTAQNLAMNTSSTLTVSNSASVTVCAATTMGPFGTSTINVQSGGQYSTATACIGCVGDGIINVTGCGSRFTATGTVTLGKFNLLAGDGTLNVSSGGDVCLATVLLGTGASGSTGTVDVCGTGSTFTTSACSDIEVGDACGGVGNFTVRGGATLTSTGACADFIIGDQSGSTGVATFTGCNTDVNLVDVIVGNNSGNANTLTVSSNACLTASGTITVGANNSAQGTLTINTGADVTANAVNAISDNASIVMCGSGSLLTVSTGNLAIQRGCLTVQGGADVNVTCGTLAFGAFLVGTGDGIIDGCGTTVVSENVSIAVGSSLTVRNCATVTVCSATNLAGFGTGTLNIQSGAQYTTSTAALGIIGDGTLNVTGCGSRFTATGTVDVADQFGNGVINITCGADACFTTVNVGSAVCGSYCGTVNVTGCGSTFTATGTVTVGACASCCASGAINLNAGSSFSACSLVINDNGVVTLNASDRIVDCTDVTVNACGVFDLNNNNETIASISGAGSVTLGSGTLTVGGDNTSTSFSGVFSETGSVTKVGNGTLTLSGSNTNSGTYTITAGQITLGASNVIDNAADMNLNGGTLEISANFSDTMGNLTVTQNSVLALNTETDLTFDSFALSATRTFNITGFAKTTKYQTNQTGISVRFAEAGGWPSYDANNFFVNGTALNTGVYGFAHGGDGFIYLILLAPEPSTYVGISALLLFVGLHWRSRRKRREIAKSEVKS